MGRFWKHFWLIHSDGYKFLFLFGSLTLLGFLLFAPAGWVGMVVSLWCARFFRDPVRTIPTSPGIVVSPADGEVVLVDEAPPPKELGLPDKNHLRIAVFMNIFNCHVNRSPVAGRVVKAAYRAGKFFNAELTKASAHNERWSYCLETDDGARTQIAVVQIAGLVARRIVSFVDEGQEMKVGERLGLIRFGSRVDVYLPRTTRPLVDIGQTMIAGETVLARLSAKEPNGAYRKD